MRGRKHVGAAVGQVAVGILGVARMFKGGKNSTRPSH